MDDHFSDIKGYRGYAKQAELLRKVGVEGFVKGFLASNAYGTPDRSSSGSRSGARCSVRSRPPPASATAACPSRTPEASMRLFAAEVLPELHTWE